MLYGQDRGDIRRVFIEAWRKHRAGEPLEPLEKMIATVVEAHPEYHKMMENPDSVERDWQPEMGESNPFLHLGMHIAIQEQLTTDRPPGILASFKALADRLQDSHEAEHRMMQCLGEALWEAQQAGTPPDEGRYLECVKRQAGGVKT